MIDLSDNPAQSPGVSSVRLSHQQIDTGRPARVLVQGHIFTLAARCRKQNNRRARLSHTRRLCRLLAMGLW